MSKLQAASSEAERQPKPRLVFGAMSAVILDPVKRFA